MLRARLPAVVLLCAAASGCSINPPLRLVEIDAATAPVELSEVPFHAQRAHHCGPASLLAQLEASAVRVPYESVVERVYVPGLEGSLQLEMLAASRGFGRIAYELPPEPEAVLAEVAAGRPVLVLLNLRLPKRPVWHYALVVGYDPARNRMILHSGDTAFGEQKAPAWLRRWDWAGRWATVLLRPGEWPAAADRDRLFAALAAFESAASPADAEAAWRRAAREWPDEPVAWLGVGNAVHRGGDLEEAASAFRRALAIDPAHLPARLNLAQTLADAGRLDEALVALGPAPDPDHPLAGAFAELERRLATPCCRPQSLRR